MSDRTISSTSRRGFLETAVVAIGVTPAMSLLQWLDLSLSAPVAASTTVLDHSSAGPASPYQCLNRDESAFVEAMVNVLCPADHLTPDGVTCGLATLVDQELAEGSVTRVRRFKSGILAANNACQQRFGVPFNQLPAVEASRFLDSIYAGQVDAEGALAAWSQEVVNPVLMQACFAGPIYDGYCNRVFWKVFGQTGSSSIVI